jgi:ferrochelatase
LSSLPFDAVLVIAFGGPQGPSDVRPFLANVLRGRRVTAERVEEVAHHYELFGGISPLTALTRAQASGLAGRLRDRGHELPVYVGMRNWHPLLADTLADMSRAGVRRAIGFIAAPHRSYSSCTQYRENVRDARATLPAAGLPDVEITYVEDWHTAAGFIESSADHVMEALGFNRLPHLVLPHLVLPPEGGSHEGGSYGGRSAGGSHSGARSIQLSEELRRQAMLVFTAHSIPVAMAERYPYREQYATSAALVADDVRRRTGLPLPHATVYQSRSGRPEDPWLGPDVCEFLRDQARAGLKAAVLCPIGFVCDHIEVLYDLDVEAASVARDVGLTVARARSVNDHPAFLEMMADLVVATEARYLNARPLTLVAG